MKRQTVLVVDDEQSICWALEKMLGNEGHDVITASSAEEGLQLAAANKPSLVILDVRLPAEDGISALPKFIAASDNAPVIIMTAFGDLESAVGAVKNGACDYLTKPFKLDDAIRACRQALQRQPRKLATDNSTPPIVNQDKLVGASPSMQQVFRQIALVADSQLSVLITGETGTGKELVAAAIHRHSNRSQHPYVAIAPVALNQDLIESELFGHVKGAFTDASQNKVGLFEQAENGTVLLDEIGDLPLNVQVKLLRVLERGDFCRVGDIQPRTANVRVIAATNCDLHQAVTAGSFREDLFHRLTGIQIHLPPLRERVEDIAPLCQHFLAAISYASADTAIDDRLLEELQSRPWHGNIRELKSAIEHAAVIARGRQLTKDDLPAPKPRRGQSVAQSDASLEQVVRRWAEDTLQGDDVGNTLHSQFLAAAEPAFLKAVLKHTRGNRAKAAELLGIHRGTLRERLRAYGIDDA